MPEKDQEIIEAKPAAIQKVNPDTCIAQIDPTSPAAIMMQLVGSGEFDVDKMGKLLELQREHDKDQARKAYHVAMAGFQAESPKIIKQKSGHNNKYAGLSDIVAVIAPLLSQHGLSHAWVTDTTEKGIKVICKITHAMGHCEETCLSAGPDTSGNKNAIQAIGSTITYLQRYTLKAALGLAEADQDDDGNGAGNNNAPPEIKPPTEANLEVIDAIIAKMPQANPGFMYDRLKVAMFFRGEKGRYPADLRMIDAAAELLMKKNPQGIYSQIAASEFEEQYDIEQEN